MQPVRARKWHAFRWTNQQRLLIPKLVILAETHVHCSSCSVSRLITNSHLQLLMVTNYCAFLFFWTVPLFPFTSPLSCVITNKQRQMFHYWFYSIKWLYNHKNARHPPTYKITCIINYNIFPGLLTCDTCVYHSFGTHWRKSAGPQKVYKKRGNKIKKVKKLRSFQRFKQKMRKSTAAFHSRITDYMSESLNCVQQRLKFKDKQV